MDKIVMVLHANDRRDGLRLRDLRDRGIAEPQMRDQAFLPQTGERRELLLQLLITYWSVDNAHQPQIDYIEPVQPSSEERRVGKECVSKCRSEWWAVN